MPARSPKVRRRRLGIELRQLRDAAGLTIDQVAAQLECSDSKISRLENGQVSATPRDVRDMAALYGATGKQLENLMQLARETREKPWWHKYGDLQTDYAAFEAEAMLIEAFSPLAIYGLLQTPDYARAVIRAVRFDLSTQQLEQRVDFRTARQQLLDGKQAPQLRCVIDEGVLRRPVGGKEVMHDQLRHLVELAQHPQVTIQVLPFHAGEHAGLDGPFAIMRFPDVNDPDMVYLEHTRKDSYLDDEASVRQYADIFNHLRGSSLRTDDSIKLLEIVADELKAV
jgi:transcriptional regulator with XRE-family HTH domain